MVDNLEMIDVTDGTNLPKFINPKYVCEMRAMNGDRGYYIGYSLPNINNSLKYDTAEDRDKALERLKSYFTII